MDKKLSVSNQGFTLVELAIVIVIIGLLVGGVLTGQELVKVSKVNSVIKDVQSYKAAMWTFYGKYNGLPGDFNQATRIWGAADEDDGLGVDCRNIESTGTETCNGNGNGKIENHSATTNEKMRFWQHLSNAKLIAGHYPGAFNSSGAIKAGLNSPFSKINNGTYEVNYWAGVYGKSGTFIKHGYANAGGVNYAGMSSEEASIFDRKIDDGISYSGYAVSADAGNASGCVSNGTNWSAGTTGHYLETTQPSCRVYYFMD